MHYDDETKLPPDCMRRRPKLGPKQPAFDKPGVITTVHYFDSAYQPEWHLKGYEVLKPGPDEEIVDSIFGKVIIKKAK